MFGSAFLDINDYLSREQVERVRARSAATSEARAAHGELAAHYGRVIDDHRSTPSKRALAARRSLAT